MPELSDIPNWTLKKTLHLGMMDEETNPSFIPNYLKRAHSIFTQHIPKGKELFRGEADDEWIKPEKLPGNNIALLQTFLHHHGFLPGDHISGVFEYRTLASVRLFQEYVRTIEGLSDIGHPDGMVGNGTLRHIKRWNGKLYSSWGPDNNKLDPTAFNWSTTSTEYDKWLDLMKKVQREYLHLLESEPTPSTNIELLQLQELNQYPNNSDSLPISEWTFNPNSIHLIGIRCSHDNSNRDRGNDDLFVLLINGMVFKFWGSTDPKPLSTSSGFEPYLVEGQHKYRMSWHKLSKDRSNKDRVYKALRPTDRGVLVFRDWSKNDSLTDEDIRVGLVKNLDPETDPKKRTPDNPNPVINIHWTADGKTNFSAGCQVIAGKSYINNTGKLIDCSKFSAFTYGQLSKSSKFSRNFRSRGAYNFLSDLILAYAPHGTDHILYTMGRDGTVERFADEEILNHLGDQDVFNHISHDHSNKIGMISDLLGVMKSPSLA